MKTALHPDRLEVFTASAKNLPIQSEIGKTPSEWANLVQWEAEILPSNKLTRKNLSDYVHNGTISTNNLIALISAWGGMHPSNGKKLRSSFERNSSSLLSVFDDIRAGKGSREEVFSALQLLHRNKVMKGANIAYFTKFLCFLRPQQDCYILDQWTGKSANILTDLQLVHFQGNYISSRNTEKTYTAFCEFIEDLNLHLISSGLADSDPHMTEMRLFSKGHPDRQAWREYVQKGYLEICKTLKPNF